MSRPLALLRPEPGWSASAAAARAAGLSVVGHPLFVAEPMAWDAPRGPFDGLLLGSAAALRHAGEGLGAFAHLPVYAVGEATAHAARAAGFTIARTGSRGLQDLLAKLAGAPLRLLRLGGEERVALHPHAGQEIVERAVYRMQPQPLAPSFVQDLASGRPVVALHSAAAAQQFAAEIDRLVLERGRLFVLALAPRIAKAAGLGWAALHLADAPDDGALLAKARALCQ